MAVEFSESARAEYEAILRRYPTKRAAVLPVLWLAQREFGWLSTETLAYVADLMGFPLAWITGVSSFYTMFHEKPVGRYHVQVCTNLSCALRGADDIVHRLEEHLGIGLGETTPDGRFTLSEVECLASCGTAPMMQVNRDYYENLTPQSTIEIVERMAEER